MNKLYLLFFIFIGFFWQDLNITYSAETQSNVSGSNTSIEGGYTGGATTYQDGSSSNSTTRTLMHG